MRWIDYKLKRSQPQTVSRFLSLSLPTVEEGSLVSLWTKVRQEFGVKSGKAAFLTTPSVWGRFRESGFDFQSDTHAFVKECCTEAVEELVQGLRELKPDFLAAAGGGKCLDAAKLVKQKIQDLPLVLIPASAATCSAFSPVSIVYTTEQVYKEATGIKFPADKVVLDMDLIMTSPARFLAAGMADTMAKWLEARAVLGGQAVMVEKEGYRSLSAGIEAEASTNAQAAYETAHEAFDKVMRYGCQGRLDHEQGRKTDAWQELIQANILLSGMSSFLGGDDFPAGAAHSFANGLTILPQSRRILHGEAVALGLLAQAQLLEDMGAQSPWTEGGPPMAEKNLLLSFFKEVGLPVDFQSAGLGELTGEDLDRLVEKALSPGESVYAMPFDVSAEDFKRSLRILGGHWSENPPKIQ